MEGAGARLARRGGAMSSTLTFGCGSDDIVR
jgi:hypothetical protein